jgi:hypothetical protein
MKIDGHCHCRQITFEAEVDPTALTIFHCTDCQTLTGSAFRINIPAPAEHFVLRGGTPKSYVKTSESGNNAAMPSVVIAPIYACALDNPQTMPCTSVRSQCGLPHHGGRSGGVLRSIG